MPYVPTNPDDEEQKKSIAGTDDAGLDGTGNGQNLPSPQQSGLSGWTDVKAYLDANKDQALGMAKNLGDKLGGEADTLKGSIDSGEKDFENQVNAGKVDFDQGTVDSALSNPADFVKDDANVEKFDKMRDANYGGPADLTGTGQYGNLQAKIKEGQSRAGNIDTEGGRQSLLFEGPGNPTKGQVTLDSLLIAGSPESRDVLKAGAGKFGTLNSYLDEQAGKGKDYATAAKASTADAGAKTKAALDTAVPGFESDVDTRLANARTTAQTRADAAAKTLKENKQQSTPRDAQALADLGLSDDDLNKIAMEQDTLGNYSKMLDPATGKPYFNGSFDSSQFLTSQDPSNQITRANLATPDDYAKAAALAKLSGQDLSGFLNPNDAAKAGSANLDTVDFDKAGGMGAVHNLVTDRDKFLAGQVFGTKTPEDPKSWAGGLDYWNNVYSGRVQPTSNPDAAARVRAALTAAIRQGWFTPSEAAQQYKRDNGTVSGGGPGANPWGAY